MNLILLFLSLHLLLPTHSPSQIASVSTSYQHISVFIQAYDNLVYYTEYSADSSFWQPWKRMLIPASGNSLSGISVCSWGITRLDVFYTIPGTQVTQSVYDTSPNGPIWSVSANAWASDKTQVSVSCATNSYGEMRIFGTYGGVMYQAISSAPSSLFSLGYPTTSSFMETPGALWILQTLYVFGRTTSNSLYYKSFNQKTGVWGQWTASNITGVKSGPALAAWDASRLDVFYMGDNYELWHGCIDLQTGVLKFTENLHGNIFSTPSVASWGYGRFDVFAKGLSDSALWTISYDECTGGWGVWEQLSDFRLA